MNKYFFLKISTLLLSYGLYACHNQDNVPDAHNHEHGHSEVHDHNHEHDHDHDHEHESLHNSDNHEDGIIEMGIEQAQFFGVECDTVRLSRFGEVIHVSGQLENVPTDFSIATSKSAGIVTLNRNVLNGSRVHSGSQLATISSRDISGGDSNESAYETMIAMQKELDRIAPLHQEGIVSTQEYNRVEADYRKAKAAYTGSKSGSKVIAPISGIITEVLVGDGEYVEAGQSIALITKGENLTLRADIPVRYLSNIKKFDNGTIYFTGLNHPYDFKMLNVKQLTERASQMHGSFMPVYFVLDNPGNLVPGIGAEIYLEANTDNRRLISVPREALSEQQGVNFVYIQLDEDCYRKVPVTVGIDNGVNVEIKSGLKEGDVVVTKGMIYVKLAESNGAVPEGHSHTH